MICLEKVHLPIISKHMIEQGRKRPLDTPERKIERRDREGKREKERLNEI